MKTVTVSELRNECRRILDWVESGEDVAISRRGKVIARLIPEKPKAKLVDWTKSAGFNLPRKGMPKLTAKQSADLLAESQGHY